MKTHFPMEKHLSARAAIGTWALLFSATLIAYLPALQGGLLWDDDRHVTSPELQSLHGLWRIWFDVGATQQYYPLLHSAFWIEHRIWGDAVLGYHLVNVALHATAAFLAIVILRRLSLAGAWLAGFLFALHPVCVEAVAWISEQKSTLSAVLYLSAALAWLHFDRARRRTPYLLATGLFVLALAAKSVTATLPAVLLVVVWWKRGRIEWKRDALPLLPWLALGGLAGIFTAWMERTSIGAQGPDFALTLADGFLLAGRALWFYAGKLLWPADLMFTYPRWTLDALDWRQYLFPAGALAVAGTLWLVARRHRGPLAGFLIFAGTLFPALGFLNVYPFIFSFVADHFQYLASLGILVPVACGLAMAVDRFRGQSEEITSSTAGNRCLTGRPRGPAPTPFQSRAQGAPRKGAVGTVIPEQSLTGPARKPRCEPGPAGTGPGGRHGSGASAWALRPGALLRICAAAACLAVPGVLTWRQSGMYRDSETLYRTTLARNPASWMAHTNLCAMLLRKPGGLAEAIAQCETALRSRPNYAQAHNNLGSALAQMPGRLPDAMAEFRAALETKPDFAEAHFNLANALAQGPGGAPGRQPEAIAEYQAALRIRPAYLEAHLNLGAVLLQMPGRLPDAIAEDQAALRIDPHLAEAHNNLGSALAQIPGRLPEAIAEYRAALEADRNYAKAHNNLGSLLAEIPGRLAEAMGEYQAALRANPAYAEAHYNLGVALAKAGRAPEAIAEFEAALRVDPGSAKAHYNLGVLLLRTGGRRSEALAHLDAALRIRPDPDLQRTVDRLRAAPR